MLAQPWKNLPILALPLLAVVALATACEPSDPEDGVDQEVCEIAIGGDAEIVREDAVLNGLTGDVLVCGGGGDAVVNTGSGRIFVLGGGEVVLNAGGSEIWVLDNGTVSLNASATTLWSEPAATVRGNASPNERVRCGTINLDLSAVDGC